MNYEDEKDYIMRIIKEMVRVLFSLIFGKQYVSLELEKENKFAVAGRGLDDLLAMADRGEINEAENLILEELDYSNKEEVAAAALFYQHLSEKDASFLKANRYSDEEILSGMRELMEQAGYGDLMSIIK